MKKKLLKINQMHSFLLEVIAGNALQNMATNRKSMFGFLHVYHIHGRIIKWTQHIGSLTLAGIAPVVEGNHGNDSKEG